MKNTTIFSMWLSLLLAMSLVWSVQETHAGKKNAPHVVAAIVYGPQNISALEGFKASMNEHGFVEGKNVIYLFDGVYKSLEEIEAGIGKIMDRNPDLIYAMTTPGALATQKAVKGKVPIVFGPVNDPLTAGIVTNLKQPGGNITGVMLTDSTAKQLEWALKIVPTIKTVFFPYNPNDKSSQISLERIQEAATILKVSLVSREVRSHQEIDLLLNHIPEGIDAIFLPRDGMVMSRVEDFVELSRQRKLVLSGTRFEMAEKGALFSFGFEGNEIGKQVARIADLILRGKKPGELPVETAEDYLAINLETAKKMGITVPEHILRQAHKIIRPK